MLPKIQQIFLKHQGKVSDKWSLYIQEWDRLFSDYRDQQIQLLEIGVQNGGSIEIFAEYFYKAKILIGCDIDPKCMTLQFKDPRIKVVIGDASSKECKQELLQQVPSFDVIVDDGSHNSSDVIRSFALYFPHLNENGIYIIEDLHTSYWNEFEGGLFYPFSSIAFLKRLIDISNFEHWRNGESREDHLSFFIEEYNLVFSEFDLATIHSIEFLNSLCIIKKMPIESNKLGERRVVGNQENVTTGWDKLNGTAIQDISPGMDNNNYEDPFLVIRQLAEKNYENELSLAEKKHEIELLAEKNYENELSLAEKRHEIELLNEHINISQATISYYAQSRSWRLTKPLRTIFHLLRKQKNTVQH